MRVACWLGIPCLVLLWWLPAVSAEPATEPGTGRKPVLSSQLDDVPQPFVPKQPRTSQDRDKLEALSLFGAARMHQQRGDLHQALRLYERALRYDPASEETLREVFQLARALNRPHEAMRYALKAVEQNPDHPELLEDLAGYLAQENDFTGALELYEKVLALKSNDPKSADLVSLWLETGRLYFLTEQIDKAADAFARVMEALEHPDDYQLDPRMQRLFEGKEGVHYELFGEALLAAKRPEEARKAFEQAHRLSGDDAMLAFHEAQVLAAQEKYEAALEQLQSYMKQKGSGALMAPYQLLGEVLGKLDRSDDLLQLFEEALAKDDANVPLRYYLAQQYLEAENWLLAEALYFELVNQSPTAEAYQGLITAYTRLGNVHALATILGQVVGRTGSLSAVADEATAIAADEEIVDALVKEALGGKSGATQDAVQGILLATALICIEAERFDEVGQLYELALMNQADDAAEIFATWGLGLLAGEQYGEAAEIFRRAIDEGALPDNPALHTYLSMALELDGKIDEAIAAAREAAELGEHTAELESRIPLIYYRAGQMTEAKRGFIEVIHRFDEEFQSEENRAALRDARLVLSNIAITEGNSAEAEEWLEQILDEYPDDINAMNDLGYIWADQGKNLQRALEFIEQAVAAEPDNQAYIDSLGWVLYRLGRYEEAVVQLEKAAIGDDTDGVILDHLGDAYQATGQPKKARQTWRQAIKAFQRDEEPEKAATVQQKLDKATGKSKS